MSAAQLPAVPVLDAAPVADAAQIVERARGSLIGEAVSAARRKPSGAQYRKAREARARGMDPKPFLQLPPAPDIVPPPVSSLPPRPTAPPAPPTAEPPRLSADDIAQEHSERARVEQIERARAPGPDRDRLEQRIGSVAQLAFTGVGYLLNRFQTAGVWPLTDAEKENVGVLLVEAFPDECAQLVQDGALVKALAIGTLGRMVLNRWELHNAPVMVLDGAEAEAAVRPAPGVPKFTGLADDPPR